MHRIHKTFYTLIGLNVLISFPIISMERIPTSSSQSLSEKTGAQTSEPMSILNAVRTGSLQAVQKALLDPSCDINATSNTQQRVTSLMVAAFKGETEIVKLLLTVPGININASTNAGNTALMYAIQQEHSDIFYLLINTPGINSTHANKNGDTAFSFAARVSTNKMLYALLMHNSAININTVTAQGNTPLIEAIFARRFDSALFLLGLPHINYNKANMQGETPLMIAIRTNNEELVKSLLEKPAININAINENGHSAFSCAAYRGNIALLNLLLQKGQVEINRPNVMGNTPILRALNNDQEEAALVLANLSHTNVNNVNHEYQNALTIAAQKGHLKVVQALLKNRYIQTTVHKPILPINSEPSDSEPIIAYVTEPTVDREPYASNSALINAAQRGYKAIVQELLAVPTIDVNFIDHRGNTALMSAITYGHIDTAYLIMRHPKIEINDIGNHYTTPLICAIQNNNNDFVHFLLAIPHLKKNECDIIGDTALHHAVLQNNKELVCALLRDLNKVSVNARNHFGETPLMYAAQKGYTSILEILLNTGVADAFLANNQGKTAFMMATENGCFQTIYCLNRYKETFAHRVSVDSDFSSKKPRV